MTNVIQSFITGRELFEGKLVARIAVKYLGILVSAMYEVAIPENMLPSDPDDLVVMCQYPIENDAAISADAEFVPIPGTKIEVEV